jgi:hypothetical protein
MRSATSSRLASWSKVNSLQRPKYSQDTDPDADRWTMVRTYCRPRCDYDNERLRSDAYVRPRGIRLSQSAANFWHFLGIELLPHRSPPRRWGKPKTEGADRASRLSQLKVRRGKIHEDQSQTDNFCLLFPLYAVTLCSQDSDAFWRWLSFIQG